MSTFLVIDFLGATTKKFEFENFKISIVDYTNKVSEDWHWHEKFHISSIIQGGNLESRSKTDIQVTPDKIMVYDQGEIHRNRFTAHPSRNLNIELDEEFFHGDLHFNDLKSDHHTKIALHKIYFELLLNDKFSSESINQILKSLFWRDNGANTSEWLLKLETLLNDRWNMFPTLDELSSELDIHPITISKYFSRYKGVTLSEYMRKLKVERAINLLTNSSKTISEIAFECGFSDQSHMTRLVKRYSGYTPGDIRST